MAEHEDWKIKHKAVERAFLEFTSGKIDAVLKGGTALMFCYGLNRFSEDLDFDSLSSRFDLVKHVRRFCDETGFEWYEKKNTESVSRCTIHYGGEKPLKIEVSHRRNNIDPSELDNINGILAYKIEALSMMKVNAYMARDRIRDLFDVCFIINKYWENLSEPAQNLFRYALAQKGLEQFDVVIAEQNDDLIDPDELAANFLKAYEIIDPRADSNRDSPETSPSIEAKAQPAKIPFSSAVGAIEASKNKSPR